MRATGSPRPGGCSRRPPAPSRCAWSPPAGSRAASRAGCGSNARSPSRTLTEREPMAESSTTGSKDPDIKTIVAQHWNRRAADFDAGASHGLLNDAQATAWHALFATIAGAAPLDVLDVGCGTGFLALLA